MIIGTSYLLVGTWKLNPLFSIIYYLLSSPEATNG